MNDAGSALLSVRAEARQLVAPDYAVVDGMIERTAAIGKARDYAAALGAALHHIEHVADAGLLGGDAVAYQPLHMTARAMSASAAGPGTPALNPVPQELIATIDARFRTAGVSLPGI